MSIRWSDATIATALAVMAVGLIAAGCTNGTSGVADAKGSGGATSSSSVPIGGPGTSPDTQSQIQAAEQAQSADRAAHAPQHPKPN